VVWAWFSVHYGIIRKIFRWIRKQFYLRAENASLTERIAAAEQRAIAAEARAAEAEAQRDILADRIKPPDLQPAEIEILRFLAVRGIPIDWFQLSGNFKIERTRFDFHINRLMRTYCLIHLRRFADSRPAAYELTEKGKEYAVTHSLC
jgi:hypothetical protein